MKRSMSHVRFLLAIAVFAVASPAFLLESDVSATSNSSASHRASIAATTASFDPNGYYRLTTEWQGTGKSLDVINDGKNNDRLILANSEDVGGQFWKITPVGRGYYRLTTEWQGTAKSLDVVNDGQDNNQVRLAKSGRFRGQFWKISDLGNGYYRLTTQWHGVGKSLDIVNDGVNNNQPILADTGNFPGQNWKITRVK